MNNKILSENYQIEGYETPKCPIYFEDHSYGGIVSQIENLVNYDFGFTVRSTFINGKPYFAAVDICKGLALSADHCAEYTMQAVNDVLIYYNMDQQNNSEKVVPTVPQGAPENPVFAGAEAELYFYLNINVESSNQHGANFKRKERMLFISEPVLYMLTFRSTKREAVAFKAWLSVEILPKLRYLGANNAMNYLSYQCFSALNQNVSNMQREMEKIGAEIQNNNELDKNIYDRIDKMEYNCKMHRSIIDQKIDSIGYNTIAMLDQQNTTNCKTQEIANGLHTIFGA